MTKQKKIFILIIIIIYFLTSFIYAEEEPIENEEELITVETVNSEPEIFSEAAILMEKNTGKVLYAKNIYDRKFPASTTKILTAIIAIEKCDLSQKMTASQNAVTFDDAKSYTKANIQAGETFTLEELLNVLMIHSANEAATIIAENISGSTEEFAKLMNEKAKELGCFNSNFVNANGIHDDNHYTTAYDMATIASYCMKNETFRHFANLMECSLPDTEFWGPEQTEEIGERHFFNTNKLLDSTSIYYYPYCIGIKTGFTTPAKNCFVGCSNKDGFELISVIFHGELTTDNHSARYMDTINMFEYGYNNFSKDEIYKEFNYDLDTNKLKAEVEEKEEQKEDFLKMQDIKEKIVLTTKNTVKDENDLKIIIIFILLIFLMIGVIIVLYIIFRRKLKNIKKAKH